MINKMKRVNMFLVAAFVAASSMLVVSCGEDDPDDVPTIEVRAKVGNAPAVIYPNDGGTVTEVEIKNVEGTALCFDVTVKMGNTKVNFITVESSRFPNGRKLVDIDKSSWKSASIKEWTMSTDKDPNDQEYGEYCTSIGNQDEILTFTAIDKNSHSSVVKITITKETPEAPTPPAGEIKYYTVAVSFGCQSHKTNPSFYSIEKGQALMLSAAKADPGKIDFVFYNSSGVKVGCPGGEAENIAFSGTKTIKDLLTTRNNNLKFIVVDKPSEYLTTWWDDNAAAVSAGTSEVAISANKVVFYQKGTTTPGAFLVKSVSGSVNDATITTDIIVKQ